MNVVLSATLHSPFAGLADASVLLALSAWSTVSTVFAILTEVVKKTFCNGHIPGSLFLIYLGGKEDDMNTCYLDPAALLVLAPFITCFIVYSCLKRR